MLNPFFARSKSRLNPAKELEGVLLASSEEPIPAEVAHRSRVIATLVIFDSRGNAFSGRFLLPVVREEVVIREYKNLVRATKARQHEKVELTHPLVAPPAPKEPSEQEKQVLVATLGRFCEDMARISKR